MNLDKQVIVQDPRKGQSAKYENCKSFFLQFYLWCSTKSIRRRSCFHVVFAQSKIGEFNVTVRVEQNILWLEVAVNQLSLVHVANGGADLGRVEFCP